MQLQLYKTKDISNHVITMDIKDTTFHYQTTIKQATRCQIIKMMVNDMSHITEALLFFRHQFPSKIYHLPIPAQLLFLSCFELLQQTHDYSNDFNIFHIYNYFSIVIEGITRDQP